MAAIIVDINEVSVIKPCENSDFLVTVEIKGWQVVCKKDEFKAGDKIVYFPPECVLPVVLSDRLGVTKYLSNGRVRSIKLRGSFSHGFAVPLSLFPELDNQTIGMNVAELLQVTKYEPPEELFAGDREHDHPLFHCYTEIENYRNYPNLIQDQTEVVLTEKLHGCNDRVALIENEWMAGSHIARKKQPSDSDIKSNLYWSPLADNNVKTMLAAITQRYQAKAVIMFCEIYGWVQDLRYGHTQGHVSFAAFDISVDGRYLDYNEFSMWAHGHQVPVAPIVMRLTMGQIRAANIDSIAEGKTLIRKDGQDLDQMREGIVIKPVHEIWDPSTGRVILKYISNTYLARKGGTEYK